MLTELSGKGGRVCRPAREGTLRCPLIIRPTSEDAITGNLFGVLKALQPRWWLADLLNAALGVHRFHRQFVRGLKIELWKSRPYYPAELLPWREGRTEVDATITWENPPTTVFCEVKYLSNLSPKTTNSQGQSEYPSDQLVRNARVGLHECGYFAQNKLFNPVPRDFVLLVISPTKDHPLIQHYRDPNKLRAAIPHHDKLVGLPRAPFIGEISYADIARVLDGQRKWLTRAERVLVADLVAYLQFKQETASSKTSFSRREE